MELRTLSMDVCSAAELHPRLRLLGLVFGSFLMQPTVVFSHSLRSLLPESWDHRNGHTWLGHDLSMLSPRVLRPNCRLSLLDREQLQRKRLFLFIAWRMSKVHARAQSI